MTGGPGGWRPAVAADLPALRALYADCARRLGPSVYTPDQVQAWVRFAAAQAFDDYILGAATALALDDAGGVCGFSGIDRSGEIRSLYVRPDSMRRGLGRALLARSMAQGRAWGLSRFSAWATPFSRALFQRCGMPLARSLVEPFEGVTFERYRMEGAGLPVAALELPR